MCFNGTDHLLHHEIIKKRPSQNNIFKRFADEIETFNNVYYRLRMKEYDETCYICVKFN